MHIKKFRISNQELDGKHHDEDQGDHSGKTTQAELLPREPSLP